MAISSANYAKLFGDLGEIIEGVNDMVNGTSDWLDQLDTALTAISSEYTTNSDDDSDFKNDLMDNVTSTINSVRDSVVSMAGTLSSLATTRLLHSTIVDSLPELGGSTTNINSVLAELARDMVDEAEFVDSISSVTIGGQVTDTKLTNTGNTVFSNRLVGNQLPHASGIVIPAYSDDTTDNLSSLFKEGEVFTLECTADSIDSGLAEGDEIFAIKATPSGFSPWGYKNTGAGDGPSIRPANGPSTNLIANGGFENWALESTSNKSCPSGYRVTAGTCGEEVVRESQTGRVYQGRSSLRLIGNSAAADRPSMRQILNRSRFRTNTAYDIGAYIKREAGYSAGTLTIDLVDSDGTIQTVAAGGSTAGTLLFVFYSATVITLNNLSDPIYLQIKFTGEAAGDIMFLDYLGVAETNWHGGIAMSIFAGQDKFLTGDRISRTITSSGDRGVFQEFFREKYHVQLPYDSSPTQADSLATD